MRRLTGITRIWRAIILSIIGFYMLLPIVAMADFSTRAGTGGGRTLDSWAAIPSAPGLLESVAVSLQLALLAVLGILVLLVPTMIWVDLRLPLMRRPLEVLCLLPIAIPAIVIVVGIAPIYRWLSQFFGSSPLSLAFVYTILTFPFAYRAVNTSLRSVDVNTLAEAARTLGASWPRTIAGIIIPNIRNGILGACVISIALVLGEFTISSLLNYETMQVVINLLGKREGQISVAVSLAALIFAFVLLVAIPTSGKKQEVGQGVG
jgi:putative spermidine/putrescine transport system permease protein